MIDVSPLDIHWRGYPVAVISDGVRERCGPEPEHVSIDLIMLLGDAEDTAQPGEPSDRLFQSHLAGEDVWIERFDDDGNGHRWSVYLPAER